VVVNVSEEQTAFIFKAEVSLSGKVSGYIQEREWVMEYRNSQSKP
jgi:hypothetical protein